MKRGYRLIGLDCANCAAKLERKISKVDKVLNCNVNFMTLRMNVEVQDDFADEVFAEVEKVVGKTLPKVKAQRCG